MSGTADTSWADALPEAAPRPSMVLPRAMQGQPSQAQQPVTVTVKPDAQTQAAADSWADDLPAVTPTKGMQAAQGSNGSWMDVLKGAGQEALHSVVGMGNDLTNYMPGPMIARMLTGKSLATQVPNPDLPPAANSAEATGRVIGAAAPGVLMGGAAGGLRGALTSLVPSLGAAAGGDIGQRAAGPIGGLAGSILGGGAAGLAEGGLEGGANAVTSRLSRSTYGEGPEAIRASDAIAAKAGQKLTTAAEGTPGGLQGVQAAAAGVPDQTAADILGGLKPENANPAAIAQAIRDQFESIDNMGAALEAGPRADVTAKTGALGTPPLPQDIGANAQAALEAVRQPEKARLDALYSAIDPQGELALGVEQGKLAARQQLTGEGAYFKPTLTGDESSLFNKIDQLPDVIPLKDYRTIMSEIGDQQRAIRSSYGTESLPFRRLSTVKSALYDDMQAAIEQQIEDETHGSVSGNVPSANTIVGRIQVFDARTGQTGPVTAAQPGGSGGGLSPPVSAEPPIGGIGASGAGNAGRSGSLGGNSQVAAEAPTQLAPNMPPEQAAALRDTNQQYAQYKQTFRTGPVGKMLAENATGTQVARALLQPEKLQAYLAATKGSPDALQAVQDALVSDLRSNSIIGPDGTINARRFPGWLADKQPILRQLPDPIRQQFTDLGPAQEAYNNAVAQHQAAVRAYQKSVAGRFLNLDPNDPNAVPSAFDRILKMTDPNSRNALMGDLYNKVAADPEALKGIKSSVIDWMTNNVLSASDPRKTMASFIDQNKPWLRRLYGGQGMQTFQQGAAAVNWRQTAQDMAKRLAAKGGGPASESGHGGNMRQVAFAWIGERLGEMMQEHHGGAIGFMAGAVLPPLMNALKQRGIQTESDLLKLAMEHPTVMRELMQRVPPDGPGPVAARRIAATIQATLATEAGQQSQQTH